MIDDREYERALAAAEEARALGDWAERPQPRVRGARRRSGARADSDGRRKRAAHSKPRSTDIEALREQVSGAAVERQQFLEANVAPYHSLIDLLIEQQQFDEALRYAERARARTLLDVVERGARHARSLADGQTNANRNAASNARSANCSAGRRRRAADTPADAATRAATRRELAALRARLFAAHPELSLARGEAAVPARADISTAIVDRSTAMLAYTVTARHAWLFVITTETMRVHPLKVDVPTLTARVRKFREAIAHARSRVRAGSAGALRRPDRPRRGRRAERQDAADPDSRWRTLGAAVPGAAFARAAISARGRRGCLRAIADVSLRASHARALHGCRSIQRRRSNCSHSAIPRSRRTKPPRSSRSPRPKRRLARSPRSIPPIARSRSPAPPRAKRRSSATRAAIACSTSRRTAWWTTAIRSTRRCCWRTARMRMRSPR